MDLIRNLGELDRLGPLRKQGALTLVPTMGALHEGHLSLVRRAREIGPVVVSIFVNPAQFGPGEDYDAYPGNLEADLEMLAPLDVDAVFAPSAQDMYTSTDGVRVAAGSRARGLCGESRPGHFDGVLTVVAKLFNLVRPEVAIFGRKDAQQCLVIDEMVSDLNIPVRLVDAPTVREPDGLAMSSRNRYLDDRQRQRALCLSRSLDAAGRKLTEGERDPAAVLVAAERELGEVDRLDYVRLHTVPGLDTLDTLDGRFLLAVAAVVGPARLIDNRIWRITGDAAEEAGLLPHQVIETRGDIT